MAASSVNSAYIRVSWAKRTWNGATARISVASSAVISSRAMRLAARYMNGSVAVLHSAENARTTP